MIIFLLSFKEQEFFLKSLMSITQKSIGEIYNITYKINKFWITVIEGLSLNKNIPY